jgi:polysaccharide deacetylase 2 family uncharacterized protein YibQ
MIHLPLEAGSHRYEEEKTLYINHSIEKIESRDLEMGIETGVYNQRGVTAKTLDEGGKQERE